MTSRLLSLSHLRIWDSAKGSEDVLQRSEEYLFDCVNHANRDGRNIQKNKLRFDPILQDCSQRANGVRSLLQTLFKMRPLGKVQLCLVLDMAPASLVAVFIGMRV